MSRSSKKQTIRLSFDQKERAVGVLRALIRCGYFNAHVPGDAELSRLLRIPRSSLALAINLLTAEGLMEPSSNGEGWDIPQRAMLNEMGEVGFVVNSDLLRGWYSLFQDWLIGFEEVMHAESYRVRFFCGFKDVDEKIAAILNFRSQGGMGFCFASRTENPVRLAVLEQEIPSVILGNSTINQEDLGCICSDNASGISKVVDYLVEQNHSNISMYVTGIGFHDGFEDRYVAYQQAMRKHHLATHSDLAFTEAHNDLTARRAADVILRMKRRPTAVICGSDREAFELVSELRHLKIEVPRDIGVVGFDNNHFGSLLEPPMTTVNIYATHMGRIAANYLLNEMQAPQLPVKIQLPTELIVRRSVQELPQGSGTTGTHPVLAVENGRMLTF